MGCFCCSLAAFWQILVFIHSAACTVPRLASAGLSWENRFLPLEGGRGFLESSKQLGQEDLSPLHFNKAKPGLAAKNWDTSSPEKGAALLHGATHCLGLVPTHTGWEQQCFSSSRTWASPFILLALPLSFSVHSAMIVWENLCKGWSLVLVLLASVSACQVEMMLPCCSQSKIVP